ncbi:DUF3993 domain-containing protein [Bacillus sp. J33]|uniref:DUF3993 domain-containing protein n=1 Tax=Bacillus sp. J33 TaxID=935836 RepID=UPI00047B521E|nr:DUF3993 domain-containing protein [Bacillus sp. J33]
MYKHLFFVFIFAAMFAVSPSHPYAKSSFSSNDEIYKFLQEAFQAQVSLSEEERSKEEVNDMLDPYFSETAKKQFLSENLVSENGKYIIYGSDSAPFYIPFFSYSDDTKVVESKDEIYVFEYFPENHEGPVSYESHYEGILLEKENGQLKVSQFLGGNIPKNILKNADHSMQERTQTSFKITDESSFLKKPSYQFSFLINPFDAFLLTGSIFAADNSNGVLAQIEKQELNGQLASN